MELGGDLGDAQADAVMKHEGLLVGARKRPERLDQRQVVLVLPVDLVVLVQWLLSA